MTDNLFMKSSNDKLKGDSNKQIQEKSDDKDILSIIKDILGKKDEDI